MEMEQQNEYGKEKENILILNKAFINIKKGFLWH